MLCHQYYQYQYLMDWCVTEFGTIRSTVGFRDGLRVSNGPIGSFPCSFNFPFSNNYSKVRCTHTHSTIHPSIWCFSSIVCRCVKSGVRSDNDVWSVSVERCAVCPNCRLLGFVCFMIVWTLLVLLLLLFSSFQVNERWWVSSHWFFVSNRTAAMTFGSFLSSPYALPPTLPLGILLLALNYHL